MFVQKQKFLGRGRTRIFIFSSTSAFVRVQDLKIGKQKTPCIKALLV